MNKDENLPYLFNEEADDAMPPMKQMGLPTSKITIAELLKPQAGSIGLVTLTFIGTEILQSREWKK